MAASTFQLFALSVLAVTLIDELEITRVQIGLLGAANTLIGALIAPGFGTLTDRIGAKRSVIITCMLSSAGLFGSALSPVFWLLLVSSLVAGIPQGWANSATNKLIAERLSAGERGTITGLKQSGVQLAIFLAGLTLPGASNLIGWRAALGIYGGVCLAVAALAAVTLADDRPIVAVADRDGLSGSKHGVSKHGVWKHGASVDARADVANRLPGFVYRVALYAFFLGSAAGGISRFIPLFAEEELGFSETRAGLVVALSGLLGMVARIIWGRLAETRISPRLGLFVLACGSALTASLLFFATAIGGGVLWFVAIGVAFFLGAWNVVAMLAVISSVRSDQSGKGTGIVMLFFLMGLTVSAPAVGWSVDQTGSYQLAWAVAIGLAVCGIITMFERPKMRHPVVEVDKIGV